MQNVLAISEAKFTGKSIILVRPAAVQPEKLENLV